MLQIEPGVACNRTTATILSS